MNQQNLEYLKDNLKYLGFNETVNTELEEKVKEGHKSFLLDYDTQYNNKSFEAVLAFRKSDNTDMYFLNSYCAMLRENDKVTASHIFYLNKGKGVTCKEAFNLLEGRAVNKDLTTKEGQLYNAWIQIDFKHTDEKGNYQVNQYHQN